jgi:hypothetical protein
MIDTADPLSSTDTWNIDASVIRAEAGDDSELRHLQATVAALSASGDQLRDQVRAFEQRYNEAEIKREASERLAAERLTKIGELQRRPQVLAGSNVEALRRAQAENRIINQRLQRFLEQTQTRESWRQYFSALLCNSEDAAATLVAQINELKAQLRVSDSSQTAADQIAVSAHAEETRAGQLQSTATTADSDWQQAHQLVRMVGGGEQPHVLSRETLIGRDLGCHLYVDAAFVSRRHAAVVVTADGATIKDLNSTNGVFVNGARVSQSTLENGSEVRLGSALFRYCLRPMVSV